MKNGCGTLFLIGFVLMLINMLPLGCNSVEITKDPVSELIGSESMEPMFTVLLFDMNQEGAFSKVYKHRYRVLKEKDGKVIAVDTKWYNVSSSYFQQNQNNLGMEMAAKDKAGKIARTIGPPGYTNYIGNPAYGYWGDGIINSSELELKNVALEGIDTSLIKMVPDESGYHSVNVSQPASNYWYFRPQHTYIRALLQIPVGKIYKKNHTEARSQYSRGFIYYGGVTSGGRRRYGTYSNHYSTNTYNKTWSRGGGGYGK
jgi:hypothetical protein